MKVLHVSKDYYPPVHGGIEHHVHDVVHGLDGFTFGVVTSARARSTVREWDGNVAVERVAELARVASSPIVPGWLSSFRASDAEVFHFHMPNPIAELAFLASRRAVPVVATYHADVVGRDVLYRLYEPVQRRFLDRAGRIVVSSAALLASPVLARHEGKTTAIPFGVDAGVWRDAPDAAADLRARLRPPLVVFLGRLVHYKGLEVLVDAMRGLDATLVIVGDGPERPRAERAARSLPEGRIVFAGAVDDEERAAYYHAADVFVLPATSRAEAFGIAMLEAMACGTPAVSTEVGTATSWVNRGGETGLVVPPGDARALRAAIGELLADEGRRRAMGAAAAARAQQHFTRERMLDALAGVYSELAANW